MKTNAAAGETPTETDAERPSDAGNETTGSEPAPPVLDESPEMLKEREIDDLRRFRVRTVPPDMRRQWMLAETPVVSTVELQDTVPPSQRPSSASPQPAPPRPFFVTPRVSSTAPTRKLPSVAPRAKRTPPRVVSREARTLRLVIAGWAIVALAVLLGLALREGPSRREAVVPSEPPKLTGLETATTRHIEETPEPTPPAAPPDPASPTSRSSPEPLANPMTKAPRTRAEHDRKLPQASPNASGKIPPAQSPRPESDIKSPLFGR